MMSSEDDVEVVCWIGCVGEFEGGGMIDVGGGIGDEDGFVGEVGGGGGG